MKILLRALVLSAILPIALAASPNRVRAQEPATSTSPLQLGEGLGVAPENVRQALLAGRYDEAQRELEALLATDTEETALWLFLSGLAHQAAGESAAARGRFELVEEEHSSSPWAAKALFRRAELLYKSGKFKATAEIWDGAAKRLRSAERQGELASVYLKLAKQFEKENASDPSEKGRAKLSQAYELYARVLDLAAPQELKQAALFSMAENLFAQERFQEAIADYSQFLDAEAESSERNTEETTEGQLLRELRSEGRISRARFQRSLARSKSGEPALARRELEDLSRDLAPLIAAVETRATEQQPPSPFEDAAAAAAQLTILKELRRQSLRTLPTTYPHRTAAEHLTAVAAWRRYLESTAALEDVLDSSEARFQLGGRLNLAGRPEEAEEQWRKVVDLLSAAVEGGAKERVARDRVRSQALFALALLSRNQKRFTEARAQFEQYTREHKSAENWSQAQRLMIECEAERAENLAAERDFPAARQAWTEFLQAHPLSQRAPSILLSIGALHDQEARKLKDEGAADNAAGAASIRTSFERAIKAWEDLIARYPGTNQAARAAFRIGLLYEEEWNDLTTAIEHYRSPAGRRSSDAIQRLAAMLETSLFTSAVRTRRSSEKVEVLVTSRNIETLEVELYRLDLEAYFQKHATYEGVQQLDLDLIAPDLRFEHSIDDYRPYALHEIELELPAEGPGTWVAVIRGEDLYSTTLVRRSDLELIVHGTAEEALIWVEDVATSEAAAGARVLLSLQYPDGTRDWIESETDAQGIARVALSEKKRVAEISVLVERNGHTASSGLNLSRSVAAQELTERGLLSTDRSIYRPGETVSWRAIVRQAENGRFVTPAGKTVLVTLSDARGRKIETRTFALSEYGTASDEFELPQSRNFGLWKLVGEVEGFHFTQQFEVANFELRKTELTAEVERDVVFRGEEVICHFTAQQFWGAPVEGVGVRVELPDGRNLDRTTDAEGKVTVRFDTRDFASTQDLRIRGTLESEGIVAEAHVRLATRGFSLQASSNRSVILLGESLSVRVTAFSALEATPMAQDLELVLSRVVRTANRGSGTVEVSRTPCSTPAELDGVLVPVTPTEEGNYIVRVEGTDRFGHPVQTTLSLYVSGEDDPTALRILSDVAEVHPGQAAEVQLVYRGEPRLSLVTFETDRIAQVQLVRLVRGVNRFSFQCEDEWVPGFRLRAAAIGDTRLHQATAEFSVKRELNVAWTLTDDWQPGEETKIAVEVTDGLGNPVQTELSLAVVDAALFDEHPDRTRPLRRAFRSTRENPIPVATAASCTNNYSGVTRTIDDAILAEEQRQEAEKEWDQERLKVIDEIAAQRVGGNFRGPGDVLSGLDLNAFEYDADFESEEFSDMIGIGGGAGGKMGGRGGGRKRLKAGGGLGAEAALLISDQSPTALWLGSVVTDENGRASVQLEVPLRSARWRLNARGVSKGAHFGEARTERSATEKFSVEIVRLNSLLEGDQPRFLVRVFDAEMRVGACTLKLAFEGSGDSSPVPSQELVVQLEGRARSEFLFESTPPLGVDEALTVRLLAEREDGLRATSSRRLEVRPYGLELADSESGILTASRQVRLELASAGRTTHRKLELEVHSGVPRWLLDTALRFEDSSTLPLRHGSAQAAQVAADLLGLLEVQSDLIGTDSAESLALRERALSLTTRLVSASDPGGSSGRWKRQAAPSPIAAALTLRALGEAKRQGLLVEESILASTRQWVKELASSLERSDTETIAMLLHAQATLGDRSFGLANRLHRERHSLSPAALSYLALALIEMDRAPMAHEVAALIEEKAVLRREPILGCRWPTLENRGPHRDSLTMTALAVHALQSARPESSRIEEGVQALLSSIAWRRGTQRGIALLVLANHYSATGREQSNFTLRVMLEGTETQTLRISPAAAENRGELSWKLPDLGIGDAREVKIDLEFEGRGSPYFRATLRGIDPDFAQADEAASKLPASADRLSLVGDRYAFAPLFERGMEVPHDWQGRLLRRAEGLKAESSLESLPSGERVRLRLNWSDTSSGEKLFPSDRLELHVPLPAGVQPLLAPLRESFADVSFDSGALRIKLPANTRGGSFEVDLLGGVPGEYRALPIVLKSSYDPNRFARGEAQALTVLEEGAKFNRERVLTASEKHYLGMAAYEAGETDRAWSFLQPFFTTHQDNLLPKPQREVATALFALSLERGVPAAIIDTFEVLKERFPELVVPIDQVQRTAEAYSALGEYERAYLIHRAIVDETFAKDLKVVGQLKALGRLGDGLEMLHRLWLEYPDLPRVIQSALTFSDDLLLQAQETESHRSLRHAGYQRARLTRAGILSLRRFLSLYPRDPLAVEAALNLVQAHLDIEDYVGTATLCDEMVDRFQEPPFSDSFLYTRAVANWYLGSTDSSVGDLKRIAQASYPQPGGGTKTSENRDLALYILAQIYHAKKETEQAEEYYELIEEKFSDAKASLNSFREEVLELSELATCVPGAQASLEVTHKNLDRVELSVYAVDLLTLYLREKDLSRVTEVELSGIAPILRREITFDTNRESERLRSTQSSIPLELEKAGAYLVLARSGAHHASGLVLVTNLELIVEEDSTSGTVRIQALRGPSASFVRDADVRVVGSFDQVLHRGETDPRGIYATSGVRGRTTVIARSGERMYAFHRGELALGQPEQLDKRKNDDVIPPPAKVDYFSNIAAGNRVQQDLRGRALQEVIDKTTGGVQVQSVK